MAAEADADAGGAVHAVEGGGGHAQDGLALHGLRGPVVGARHRPLHAALRRAQQDARWRPRRQEQRHLHVVRVDEREDLVGATTWLAGTRVGKKKGGMWVCGSGDLGGGAMWVL